MKEECARIQEGTCKKCSACDVCEFYKEPENKYLMAIQAVILLKVKLQMLNELFYKINIQAMFMMKLA